MLFDFFRMKILVDSFLHCETHALLILGCPRLALRDSWAVLLYLLRGLEVLPLLFLWNVLVRATEDEQA